MNRHSTTQSRRTRRSQGRAAARRNAPTLPRAIRVGSNQGGEKFGFNTGGLPAQIPKYRGFISHNTKIPGVYRICHLQTGGLSKNKKKSRDKPRNWGILDDKPPVLGKFRSTPSIEPKFFLPLVWTYPDGARQRRRVAPRRRAPP